MVSAEFSNPLTPRLRKNIFRLYGFSFFQMFLVAIPVIVPFWQEAGLSLHDIFLLQGIFGATLIVFDVPAGYLADYFGRKRCLVIGSVITLLGFQTLWWGKSFLHFAIYEVIVGLGMSLQSGCDVAILYTSLEQLQDSGRKAKFLGKRVLAIQIGEGVASLLGGYLATFSLKLPMIVNAITPVGAVIFAALLYDNGNQQLKKNTHLDNVKMIKKALFGHSKLLTLLILAYVFYSFATYCAVWMLQIYWKDQGVSIGWFGALWAGNCFLIGAIGRWAHWFETKIGSVASVALIAVTPIIGYLGMGYFGGWLGISFMIFFPICRGLNMVLFQDAVNSRVPSDIRATTNSIGSLGMRMMFIVFGPLLGYIIDHLGLVSALKIMGGIYIVGLFIIAAPLIGERKHFVQS